jgi:diguanylate cyclase (GGDEF)-like protein
LAVACVDLDNFKAINNSLGHHVGDEVLKVMARRLSGCLRDGDTIARIGGDEFVVSLPDIRSSMNLFQIARKILNAISLPLEIAGRELHITASIGIAIYPEHGKDAETLIKHADLAMYNAKHLGRNRHQIFVEHMSEQVQQEVQLEDEMWRALGSNEFMLYYQPIIDLKTGVIVGAEALLRWPNTHGTWMSPADFIPVCERCGLIAPLSEWVLVEACSQLQSWRDSGHGMNNFTMAVNLSPRHFASTGLPTLLGEVIEQSEIDPRWLHLDISESLLMGMSESIRTNFEGIKKLGVKFSLDDFGTGFSSLGYLRNYPIDLLKIDRSLIRDLPEDADHAAIVTTIIALANSLGLTVVAKGVETDAQVEFLRKQGCHQAQGFLFSRPLPADEFMSLVLERRNMLATQSLIPFKETQ